MTGQSRKKLVNSVKHLTVSSKVSKSTIKCDACYTSISADSWYFVVKLGRSIYRVHDNEGICLEGLKVNLGVAKPSFLSSRLPFQQDNTNFGGHYLGKLVDENSK